MKLLTINFIKYNIFPIFKSRQVYTYSHASHITLPQFESLLYHTFKHPSTISFPPDQISNSTIQKYHNTSENPAVPRLRGLVNVSDTRNKLYAVFVNVCMCVRVFCLIWRVNNATASCRHNYPPTHPPPDGRLWTVGGGRWVVHLAVRLVTLSVNELLYKALRYSTLLICEVGRLWILGVFFFF